MSKTESITLYGQELNATGAELLEALDKMADNTASTRLLKREQDWNQNHLDYRVRKVGGKNSPFLQIHKQPDTRSGQEIRIFELTPAGREALQKFKINSDDELPEEENQIAKLTKADVEGLEADHEEFKKDLDLLDEDMDTVFKWIDAFDIRLRAIWLMAVAKSREDATLALELSQRVEDESEPEYTLPDAVAEFQEK